MVNMIEAQGKSLSWSDANGSRSLGRRAMTVLWPSFLMAGVLEMVVFALVDPAAMRWFGGVPVGLSASAVYTLAFFIFWVVIAVAGSLTLLLALSAADVNRSETDPDWAR
jgi:hypothetical protein